MKRKVLLAMVLLICMGGCIKTTTDDGETTYRVDPNEIAKYEKPVEDTVNILTALSPLFPFLIPFATGIGGALGIWKLQKPKLVKARTKSELYYDTANSLVATLEKFKETNPTEYVKLKERLVKTIGSNTENVIRALRGLPPKK